MSKGTNSDYKSHLKIVNILTTLAILGVNVEQSPYNSKFFHGSFPNIISHIWNCPLPAFVKNAHDVASFRRHFKVAWLE